MASKIDWEPIRNEYIESDTSYRLLAEKYGITYQAIGRRAKSERWGMARAEFRHKVMTEMIKKSAKGRARANLDALDDVMRLTAKLKCYAEEMLDDSVARAVNLSSGRDWDSMAGMIEKIEGITRRYADILTEAERRSEKRAEKKLKAEMKKNEGQTGPQVVEVIMGDAEKFTG